MGIESSELNELERRRRQLASGASLVLSLILLVAKFWAFNLTNSQAIFSDAMESIVNVVAAAMAVWVIWYSAKPADEDHPYGHGKVEFFSAAFEGGLIAFAALMIIAEASLSFTREHQPQQLGFGVLVVGVAGLINLGLGVFLSQTGQRLGSIALKASGAHVISDFWTSAGVVVGLSLAHLTGWLWLDPVIAIGVGLWLAYGGLGLMNESVGGLMDKENIQILGSLVQVFEKHIRPGIIQLHHVKVIRSGWYHHIDAHVVMPEFWDVRKVHQVMGEFEGDVIREYEFGGEMNFHIDPCGRAYCSVCPLESCPIREKPFSTAMPVSLEHLRSPVEPQEFRRRRRH